MDLEENAKRTNHSNPTNDLIHSIEVPLGGPERVLSIERRRAIWKYLNLSKILLFAISLYLFILAISLMKDGARSLAPLIEDSFRISNPANSLGFGWLFAYTIMSGSPVAAASLTFFDAGVLSKIDAYAMITGSRLGASFIVLFMGLVYVLRGRDRSTSLSMGVLSLTVTASTYLPALFLGAFIINTGILDSIQIHSGILLPSLVEKGIEPISGFISHLFPNWIVFLFGLGIILVSFYLFDRCLPQITIKESRFGWMSRLVYRPLVMFFLGAVITMVSMSVSVSLGILVPMSARGFVRRENVIPYIMGANITTFVDTLFASVLLNNPPAFTIVFVEMISITLISLLIMWFVYEIYHRSILKFVSWSTDSNLNLCLFMGVIFLVPILLIMV